MMIAFFKLVLQLAERDRQVDELSQTVTKLRDQLTSHETEVNTDSFYYY